MFLKTRLRKMKTRYQTKYRHNFVPYGHALVPLRDTFQLLKLVDIQEFVATYSYKRPFKLVSFVLLLRLVLS